MKETIVMYTDGGSRGNPGKAGIGVYIETLDKKYSQFIGDNKTNNEAEYEALIFGLKKIKHLFGGKKVKDFKIICKLDSELIVKQLNHEYKLKEEHIQAYFIELWNLTIDFGKIEYKHVPRTQNKIADKLANEAMDLNAQQATLF